MRSTPITCAKPPRRPASTPASASSTTIARSGTEPSCRVASKKTAGSGLPSRASRPSHQAVDLYREQRAYARGFEDRCSVLAGRDDRGADAELLQATNQPNRALEGLDAVALEHVDEVAVLAVAEPADRLHIWWVARGALRQRDVARGKEAAHAVVAGLAVDVDAIVPIDIEGSPLQARGGSPLLQEIVEQLLPGGGVHRCGAGDHPVHVEDDGVDRRPIDGKRSFVLGHVDAPILEPADPESPLKPCPSMSRGDVGSSRGVTAPSRTPQYGHTATPTVSMNIVWYENSLPQPWHTTVTLCKGTSPECLHCRFSAPPWASGAGHALVRWREAWDQSPGETAADARYEGRRRELHGLEPTGTRANGGARTKCASTATAPSD